MNKKLSPNSVPLNSGLQVTESGTIVFIYDFLVPISLPLSVLLYIATFSTNLTLNNE